MFRARAFEPLKLATFARVCCPAGHECDDDGDDGDEAAARVDHEEELVHDLVVDGRQVAREAIQEPARGRALEEGHGRAENALDVLSDVALMMRGRGAVMTISSNMAEFVHFYSVAERVLGSARARAEAFVLADADTGRIALNDSDVSGRTRALNRGTH